MTKLQNKMDQLFISSNKSIVEFYIEYKDF